MLKDSRSQHADWILLEFLKLIKESVGRYTTACLRRLEIQYDKPFRQEPQIHVGEEDYIVRSQHDALASGSAEQFAQNAYTKLM